MKRYPCVLLFLWTTAAWSQSADSLRQQLRMAQSDTARLRLYSEIGNLFTLTDDFDSVAPILRKAWPLASRVGTTNYLGRLHFLQGMVYRSQGRFDKSIVTFQRALALTTQANDRVWISHARYLLAVAYTDKADYKQALIQSMSNLAYAQQQPANRLVYNTYALLICIYEKISNHALADFYRAKFKKLNPDLDMQQANWYEARGDFAGAGPYLKKLVADVKSKKVKSKNDIIFMLTWAAKNLRCRRKSSEALRYLQEAFQTDGGRKDAGALNWVWEELSQLRLQVGQPRAALRAAQEAVRLARLDKPTELVQRLLNLALIQEATGHYQQALLTYKKYHVLQESLLNLEKTQQIVQIHAHYELNQKEQTILLLNRNAQLQRVQAAQQDRKLWQLILGIGTLISLVSLIGLLLYRANKKRRLLLGQKQLIETQAHELQETNRTKDQLFSIVGHDLRAPILGMNYLLKEVRQSSPQALIWPSLLDRLTDRIGQLGGLVDNLLYWSLGQQGLLQNRIEPIDLHDLLTNCMTLFTDIVRHKALHVGISGNLAIQPWADERQLQIIVRNLVDNAIKFSPVGGDIEIDCIEQSGGFLLEITNQIDSHRDQSTGANLGLKTVTELADRHNGTLAISQPQMHSWRVSLTWPHYTTNLAEGEPTTDRRDRSSED